MGFACCVHSFNGELYVLLSWVAEGFTWRFLLYEAPILGYNLGVVRISMVSKRHLEAALSRT